jgi:hypothetical protein
MPETGREIPRGLSEFHVFRLFKCAVKDDHVLVDAIVERLYVTMKEFDSERAKQTVGLVVDRDTTAATKLRALLDDLWPPAASRRSSVTQALFNGADVDHETIDICQQRQRTNYRLLRRRQGV